MTNNAKWLRYFRLYVATDNDNKEALDLSDFRVKFRISQQLVGKPCTAEITVYNVAKSTVDRIHIDPNATYDPKNKLQVIIEAGYENDHGVIFRGDLWWKSTGRESETDTFMRLVCATGDHAHQYAVVNASIPKGATQNEVFGIIAKSMKDKGVKEIAHPDETMEGRLPRGKVLYMLSERAMNGICDTNGFYWGYGNDGIIAVPKAPTYDKDKDVIVLNAQTGLIGRPKITANGIELTCLLDPRLDFHSLIQIDNASIQREAYKTDVNQGVETINTSTNAMESADGLYRVLSREIRGDTRGTDWYCVLICEGVNASIKPMTPTVMSTMANS